MWKLFTLICQFEVTFSSNFSLEPIHVQPDFFRFDPDEIDQVPMKNAGVSEHTPP